METMAWMIFAGLVALGAQPAVLPPETEGSPATTTEPAPTATATTTTTAPATTAPATSADAEPAAAEPSPPPETTEPPRTYPRLVLAAGPMLGPHAIGNQQCLAEEARCEKKGSFLGAGANLELRARLYRPLYLSLRGVAVANASPNDPIYSGLVGGGVGLGAYGRRIFGRAEYLLVHALGDDRFEPPFAEGKVARDEWGNHAGMVSVGFRQPLPKGLALELWAGPMFGPRSVRRVPQVEPDERVLVTFMLGLNLAWDAWN